MYNVSQNEWDRIFARIPDRTRLHMHGTVTMRVGVLPIGVEPISIEMDEDVCCGCEGCGFDCGCLCS